MVAAGRASARQSLQIHAIHHCLVSIECGRVHGLFLRQLGSGFQLEPKPVANQASLCFILDTQARLEATAGLHDERLGRMEASIANLTGQVGSLTGLVGQLAQAGISLVGRVDQLAGRMDQLAGRMDRLAELQTHTDQRLNALIDVVDKLISRNGHDGNKTIRP